MPMPYLQEKKILEKPHSLISAMFDGNKYKTLWRTESIFDFITSIQHL